jgi:O-antigen ligase
MNKITTFSLFFLAVGILTSVTTLSAYQILFTVFLLYYCIQFYKDKELKLPKSAYWLSAFTLVNLITSLKNIELMPKPSKNLGQLKYFLSAVAGIYVFRYWFRDATDKTKKIIFDTFLLSVIIVGLFAMTVYFFTQETRASLSTETMHYSYGSAMFLITLLIVYLQKDKFRNWFDTKWVLIALVIGFSGTFFTYTREALLEFLFGLAFDLYFYNPEFAIVGSLISLVILGGLDCFKAGGLVRALVIPLGVAFIMTSQFEVTLDANNASMFFFVYSFSAAIYSKANAV